jgi:hypothetical protein
MWLGITLVSCTSNYAVTKGARITLPQSPERIAWQQEDVANQSGVHYVDPPIRLQPGTQVTASSDGGIVLTPRAWRGIRYALTEWPKWGDTVRAIVDSHNRAMGAYTDNDTPWWKIWK